MITDIKTGNAQSVILATEDLTMAFGGLIALNAVNLEIAKNSITALIGPNGAGKTTLFNCLTGIYRPTAGSIFFVPQKAIQSIRGQSPDSITALGMARTFQNIRLFNNLTVLENVLIGRHTRLKAGLWGALTRNAKTRAEEKEAVEYSYSLLARYGLGEHANTLAKNLPYGAQRRLEIVRALATEPKLLLLDEPAAGLNIGETKELEELIVRIRRDEQISILLIEHDMSLVMSVSEKVYVMDYGRLIASAPPAEVKSSPVVIKAYLGEEVD